MNLDISNEIDLEITQIMALLIQGGDFEQEDDHCLSIETPYDFTAYVVFFPELLTYYGKKKSGLAGYLTVPWICCRTEIETQELIEDNNLQRTFARWLVDKFKDVGLIPFHDEDAFAGYFSRKTERTYIELSLYVNPSYPEGYWCNHTL